jgi:hypothetical protein
MLLLACSISLADLVWTVESAFGRLPSSVLSISQGTSREILLSGLVSAIPKIGGTVELIPTLLFFYSTDCSFGKS